MVVRTKLLLAALLALAACGNDAPPPGDGAAPPDPPEWFAAFGGSGEQFLFVAELRRHFAARGEHAAVDADGLLHVEGPAGEQRFVLVTLAELAARTPASEWPELIERHFEAMQALRDAAGDVVVPGWDEARPRLRLRIYPDRFLTEAGLEPADVVHRVDLPGSRTVLVVDSETTAIVVPRDELLRWGTEPDQALALARGNTKQALADALEINEREFPGIGTLRVLTGESFYAASAVLWLEEWPELLGTHGAIVAVPWRHGVFVYPFDDARIVQVVPALYRYAERIVQDVAGPIGPDVWWRRPDGSFAAIEVGEEADGRLAVVPPPDLAELLQTLR